MSEEIPTVIYAPSLYWFAYRTYEGLVIPATSTSSESLGKINPKWVKKNYQNILAAFGLTIWEGGQSRDFDLLEDTQLETSRQYEYFIVEEGKLEGFIYPQTLHDSYALNLNLFYPENPGNDEYNLEDLERFNPQNCFLPTSDSPVGYLGQTLLLTAYLSVPRPDDIGDLEELAKQCWLAFFKIETLEKFPHLYRSYNFSGGYLYEYGNPRTDLTENPYGHLLIWFYFDESPSLTLQKYYWELPELLLYYHKISSSFQDSRSFYREADKLVKETEERLTDFHEHYLNRETEATFSEADLTALKTTLKKFLKISLDYSKYLRNLEYMGNTIAINAKNYQATLEYMEKLAETPLEAFHLFAQKEAIAFQNQIEADIKYFRQGYGLLDKAIATLRGLVEIDQAQRDRDRLEQEKARLDGEKNLQDQREKAEKNLQDQIQAIGVGVAAGAIVASSSSLMTQPVTWPWQKDRSNYPHPFLTAVIVSSVAAFGIWLLMKKHLEKRRSG